MGAPIQQTVGSWPVAAMYREPLRLGERLGVLPGGSPLEFDQWPGQPGPVL